MRYLVVSLGSIGRRHLRNLRTLRPNAEIAVLRQHTPVDGDAAPEYADRQFTTLDEAISFRPEAAIIAGPASRHLGAALPLAKAGVHLLVEKPLADRLEETGELVEFCREHRLVLMTGYNLRFLPSLREARRLVMSGAIGTVLGVRAEVGQYLPNWRPNSDYRQTVTASRKLGGGAILELSHELDYIFWFFGMPSSVTAKGGRYSELEIDVEDMVEITLEYQSPRRLVNIHIDMLQRSPVRQCRFIGDEGTLLWDGLTDRIEYCQAVPGVWKSLDQFACADRNTTYLEELEHFFRCIELDETPLVDGMQGRNVLAIADAARRSLQGSISVEMN